MTDKPPVTAEDVWHAMSVLRHLHGVQGTALPQDVLNRFAEAGTTEDVEAYIQGAARELAGRYPDAAGEMVGVLDKMLATITRLQEAAG